MYILRVKYANGKTGVQPWSTLEECLTAIKDWPLDLLDDKIVSYTIIVPKIGAQRT